MGKANKRPKKDAAGEDVEMEDAKKEVAAPATTDGKPDTAGGRTLFVRSLPYTTTTDALSTHFSFVAPIKHATVVVDPATKKSRGFGFVTFADAEDAQRAVQEFNGADFEGRRLKVEVAEPRHREKAPAPDAGISQTPVVKRIQDGEGVKRRCPRLIVRNLPWSLKDPQQLVKIFQSYGKVRDVIIPKKHTGEMCGFAIVAMKGYKNVERAIEKTNGMTIGGRIVAVDWAVEKAEWESKKAEEDEEQEENVEEDEGETSGDEENHVGVIDDEDAESMDNASSEDEDEDIDTPDTSSEDEDPTSHHPTEEQNATTIFIRNLPFTTTDESLHAHFTKHFGPVRYARIVIDPATERPRGTAFVCFYKQETFNTCLSSAPRQPPLSTAKHSVLQNEQADPSGKYTLEGRILSITRAVKREEAAKLQEASASLRDKTHGDNRRLFLLHEGTIPPSSPLFQRLSSSEQHLREASLQQRRTLLKANPALHLSLTRLSIRNLPRFVTAKDLKQLAREAVVGFSTDVKAGLRQPLSKEELTRGGEADREAERRRRNAGKGIVRQAKVVEEKSGAGRSKGYGFIEYSSHRWALMGLRWLNGYEVSAHAVAGKADAGERRKRLVVEFAIENAQVVARRREKEEKARERSRAVTEGRANPVQQETRERKLEVERKEGKGRKGWKGKKKFEKRREEALESAGGKRKRGDDKESRGAEKKVKRDKDEKALKEKNHKGKLDGKESLSVEVRNIVRKRRMRKKKAGK